MNRSYVCMVRLGLIMSLIVPGLACAMSQVTLEATMTSAHNAAFGVGNLFKDPIASKDINNWNAVITEVEKFVKKNVTLNSDLTKAMKTLKEANTKIIAVITDSYRLFFAKPDSKNDDLKRNTAASLQYVIDPILSVEKDLKAGIDKGHRLPGNQVAAQVLYRLAVSLSTTAEKAQRELRK